MSVEERREMIATAAIPLYVENGSSVTTKQLADHLGIAEGTIFRAYGDKDALVRAVVDAYFAQADKTLSPALIDPTLSLREKLFAIIRQAREHTQGMFTMLSLLDPSEVHEYMKQHRDGRFDVTTGSAFDTDAAELNVAPEKLAALLRLLVIASSAPRLSGGSPLSDEDLVNFTLYGIAGHPHPDSTDIVEKD